MALHKLAKVICADFLDRPFIDDAGGDVAVFDEFTEPSCGFGIVFIVPVHRLILFATAHAIFNHPTPRDAMVKHSDRFRHNMRG